MEPMEEIPEIGKGVAAERGHTEGGFLDWS